MARIVAGFASSFSPQLHVPVELWSAMGERDRAAQALLGPDGKTHSYDELLQLLGPKAQPALASEEQAARHKKCQDDIALLGKKLQDTQLDALIVFADDEHILFDDDNWPAAFVYFGETVPCVPRAVPENAPAATKAAAWAYGDKPVQLPGAPELGEHIMWHFMHHDINISHSRYLHEGKSIGHPFGFANTRLLNGKQVPMVPVIFNASYPPNVPTPSRTHRIGEAIGEAVQSWQPDARVGVLAVGGFSHPVIDEEMDRIILRAIEQKDAKTLRSLPKERLAGGNGQTRTWIAAAGALQNLNMHLLDYIPAYRSPGGTGCGMGFAYWD